MSAGISILLGLLAVVVGALIGGVGIGGVLLVPGLVYLGGVEIHAATATAMWAFLFSGAVATALYARRGSIDWPTAGWLCAGAMPTAYVGALVMAATPGRILLLVIAVLVVASGANALIRRRGSEPRQTPLAPWTLVAIGALTGFGSALSGTGGPLVLMPVLIWLRLPALAAVGLGQVVQVPIASLASLANLMGGYVDIALGTGLAVAVSVGVYGGVRLAHAAAPATLRRTVAAVLVLTGIFMIARLVLG